MKHYQVGKWLLDSKQGTFIVQKSWKWEHLTFTGLWDGSGIGAC